MNPFLAQLIACGRVQTDGSTSAAGFFAKGCAVARTGVGVYTITLDRQVDASSMISAFTTETADVNEELAHTSDTVKTVTWSDLETPADTDATFSFGIWSVSGAAGA